MPKEQQMTKVFTALATSVDGYITGPNSGPDQPLGTGGGELFDWYGNGDTPSREFSDFRLSAASAAVFDALAGRVGAVIAGRKTYDDSKGWGGRGPHPTAPLFVLTRPPLPDGPPASWQTFVTTGIEDAISSAKRTAAEAGKDVGLMGSGVIREALLAGLLDEFTVHQVLVLLGGGVPFFRTLPAKIRLERLSVVEADGVTHLRFAVVNRD
jgi:dihydrofolate reductase